MTGSKFDQNLARIAVGAYDDAQDVRTAMMNRVRDIVRKKNEGIPFDEVEAAKDDDEQDFGSTYDDENLPGIIREMREENKLTDHEFEYLRQMLDAGQQAKQIESGYKSVMEITENEPIYTEWLQHVTGVSTTLTARLIHHLGYCGPVSVVDVETGEVLANEERDGFDHAVDEYKQALLENQRARAEDEDKPYKLNGSPRVSNLWSYAGLAPGQRRRRGERASFDTQLKTTAWNVADCIIKQGSRSKYREAFYDPYKQKQVHRMEAAECPYCGDGPQGHDRDGCDEFHATNAAGEFSLSTFEMPEGVNDDATPPWSQGHADARARRYLMKKFLKHYWWNARDLQGYHTPEDWVVTHGGHDGRTDSFENPAYARKALTSDDVVSADD